MSTYDPLADGPLPPKTTPFLHPKDDVPESDPSTLPKPVLTFGQKAVGLTFNPGGSIEVSKFKEIIAIAIDEMNDLRNSTTSQEVKRLCSVTITELQGAQMFGVKAITWVD